MIDSLVKMPPLCGLYRKVRDVNNSMYLRTAKIKGGRGRGISNLLLLFHRVDFLCSLCVLCLTIRYGSGCLKYIHRCVLASYAAHLVTFAVFFSLIKFVECFFACIELV